MKFSKQFKNHVDPEMDCKKSSSGHSETLDIQADETVSFECCCNTFVKSVLLYRPGVAQRVPGSQGSQIS
jgi:hypothetical protein